MTCYTFPKFGVGVRCEGQCCCLIGWVTNTTAERHTHHTCVGAPLPDYTNSYTRMARPSAGRRAGKRASKALGKMGAFACKSVFWICCGPCVLCALCFIKPNPRRRGCVIHSQPPPRPTTPPPRLRHLTMPVIDMQDDQKTLDQSRSPFISKLPLEIRRMIYFEMLGGVTVKLRTARGKPVARRYRRDSGLKEPYHPRHVQLEFVLSMLRTCRQM
jgi:hypothetical protein